MVQIKQLTKLLGKSWQQQHKGFTIVEVLIAMAVAASSLVVFLSFSSLAVKSRVTVEKREVSKKILVQNLLEIKGNTIASLPAAGNCRLRKYDLTGEYIAASEQVLGSIDDTCGYTGFTSNTYYLFTRVKSSTTITANFDVNTADFMKLPKYSNMLYEIDLIVLYKDENENEVRDTISFFKR